MSDRCTLLVTDIVDSTALTERIGDEAAARLWTAHDRLARDLLPRFRGREIDHTDGLLLLFADVAGATDYALAYHRALRDAQLPMQARVGLHVGHVILRDNTPADIALGAKAIEVDGIAKAMAARIAALAGAGQTLLSSDARQALDYSGPRIVSHGHWRLKGLSAPIELFEVGAADAAFEPPADQPKAYRVVRDGELWLPKRELKYHLPAERDAFVGRAETLDLLARLFDEDARVVSVTGIGGTGKTRLVTRFAWSWLGDFPGGAWFCDLAQARSIDGICHAVGQALDVPLGKDDSVIQLGNAIAARGRCLVVLDNFEQVARHAEATLGRWCDRAGAARFLVTSRGALGLPGESVLALAPLLPADASALFIRRAQAARRDFEPSDEDLGAIGPLVGLLDGLPLAIELAAARVRVMPPRSLLARMSERFKLLATSGGRPDRQATLRATFDWSWDLLTLPEKAALAQLSVFEGGFSLEAAESVLDLALADDAPWPLDAVQSLVEKSLVRARSDDRFDLLVSVQEYAAEHLRTEGRYSGSGSPAARAAEARHSAYFGGLDEAAATAGRGIELENLVAACRRSAACGAMSLATRTLELAWAGLNLRGPFRVCVDLAERVRAMPGLPPDLMARAGLVGGCALREMGRGTESRTCFDMALQLACQVGDRACEAGLRCGLGELDSNEGRIDEARVHLTEAVEITRQAGPPKLQCEAHNALGTLNLYAGRIEDARNEYSTALALARASGNRHWEGGVLGNLGTLDSSQGHWADARAHFEAGLQVARELGNRKWEGNALCNLGLLHAGLNEMPQALQQLQAALDVARDLGSVRLEAIVLCNLGIAQDSTGQCAAALHSYEAALAIARELRDRRSEGQFLGYLGALHARAGRFDEARCQLEAGEALLRTAAGPIDLGVLLCGRAEMEWLAGAHERARLALADAESIAGAVPDDAGSELAAAVRRARQRLADGAATGC